MITNLTIMCYMVVGFFMTLFVLMVLSGVFEFVATYIQKIRKWVEDNITPGQGILLYISVVIIGFCLLVVGIKLHH